MNALPLPSVSFEDPNLEEVKQAQIHTGWKFRTDTQEVATTQESGDVTTKQLILNALTEISSQTLSTEHVATFRPTNEIFVLLKIDELLEIISNSTLTYSERYSLIEKDLKPLYFHILLSIGDVNSMLARSLPSLPFDSMFNYITVKGKSIQVSEIRTASDLAGLKILDNNLSVRDEDMESLVEEDWFFRYHVEKYAPELTEDDPKVANIDFQILARMVKHLKQIDNPIIKALGLNMENILNAFRIDLPKKRLFEDKTEVVEG